jgi:flagellar basal body-associated protein FliL
MTAMEEGDDNLYTEVCGSEGIRMRENQCYGEVTSKPSKENHLEGEKDQGKKSSNKIVYLMLFAILVVLLACSAAFALEILKLKSEISYLKSETASTRDSLKTSFETITEQAAQNYSEIDAKFQQNNDVLVRQFSEEYTEIDAE